MEQTQTAYEMLFKSWQQQGIAKSQVAEELKSQGLSAEEITSVLDNYTRYRIARRNTMGWALMGLGGFIGLASCILTILDIKPDFRGFFMYGLTSLSVTIALYGCYLVMEKASDE